jgi:hypothetical protein
MCTKCDCSTTLSKPAFDPAKPVQTRDGRKARIICTDSKASPHYPLLALVGKQDGSEIILSFTPGGAYQLGTTGVADDLVNIPEETVLYVNVYPQGYVESTSIPHNSTDANRVACVRVVYKEGQFDD